MIVPELIALDRQSAVVWPCLREERLGEWILRFGGGVYGRSNSVQPFGDPGLPLPEALETCEAAYASEGLPAMFRVPHVADWGPLDELLEARGYEINDAAIVQVAALAPIALPDRVELTERPDREWLTSYIAGSGRGAGREAAVEQILLRLPSPRRFAAVRAEGRIVAIGVGSVFEGTLWMFGIATVPEFRGQGLGRLVCEALMSWAYAGGAHRAALQVSSTNEVAVRLYERLGFSSAYEYTYRRRFL